MEKTFVNVLAYSKILKSLLVCFLIFVVIVNIMVVSLVAQVIDQATAEERSKIIALVVVLILSSAAGFPLFYAIYRGLKDQWIKIDDSGIKYNSWGRKISAGWDEVTGVFIVSRGRYGQALRNKGLRIDTKNGRIYATPLFVDKSQPIPQIRLGFSSQKMVYPDGKVRKADVEDCDVYREIKSYMPELLH